ncbi:unnamed protein product [Allacma fusca]|uniref:Uncharacterized protein n=1 Tax=Allacma fusca TaxID=39272 RepID=A0A8J2LFA9_9HEXA|nr:unnamed protein product [Allacma fusca]
MSGTTNSISIQVQCLQTLGIHYSRVFSFPQRIRKMKTIISKYIFAFFLVTLAFQQVQSKPRARVHRPRNDDSFYSDNAIDSEEIPSPNSQADISGIFGEEIIPDDRQIFEAAIAASNDASDPCPDGKARVQIGEGLYTCPTTETKTKPPGTSGKRRQG